MMPGVGPALFAEEMFSGETFAGETFTEHTDMGAT